MPSHYEVAALPAPTRAAFWGLWAAYRDTPSDLLTTRDGFTYSFDAYCLCVLPFRLRPRPAHLAVRDLIRSLPCANPVPT
jgi:hypothetical protein